MDKGTLTEQGYWDSRWERVRLPVEVKKDKAKFVTKELIRISDKYLPKKDRIGILEIGGAPGKWLVYFKKNFHYDIHALDYSQTGCEKMQENFNILKLKATIYRYNILTDDLSGIPPFDIVYSFGFIEHFSDLNLIFEKHLAMVKQEGILMIGVPNFLGITRKVLQKTAPRILSTHNLQAMDLKTWEVFEERYQLQPIFKGYIGGFDLHHCRRCESRTLMNRLIRLFFKIFTRITGRMSFLRRFNSKNWSPYLLVMYKKS